MLLSTATEDSKIPSFLIKPQGTILFYIYLKIKVYICMCVHTCMYINRILPVRLIMFPTRTKD